MVRTLRRSVTIRLRILAERARAQALRTRFAGVRIHRAARLARGVRVDIAPGGRLDLGPCAVGEGVLIEVGPKGSLKLQCDYVGPRSVVVVRDSVRIGSGTLVAEMCVIRDSDHARSADGVIHKVDHVSAPIEIGSHCWLGARSIVLKGVTMQDRSTAGAGSVVTRDVEAGVVVVGSPARPIVSD